MSPLPPIQQVDIATPIQNYYAAKQRNRQLDQQSQMQNQQMQMNQMQMNQMKKQAPILDFKNKMDSLKDNQELAVMGINQILTLNPDAEDFDKQAMDSINGYMDELQNYGFSEKEATLVGHRIVKLGGMSAPVVKAMQKRMRKDLDLDPSKKIQKVVDAGDRQVVIYADGSEKEIFKGDKKEKPQSAVAKINEDFKNGFIDKAQHDAAIAKATTHQDGTTVNVDVGGKSLTELGKKQAAAIIEEKKGAEDAVASLQTIAEGKKLLDSGMITGIGSHYQIALGKALQKTGFNVAEEPIKNSEAYASMMGKEVGRIIKMFGSGTGLSDADREYAEKIVAGNITLTEKSIRKILSINEKASRNVIENYNKKADQVMGKEGSDTLLYDMRVEMPDLDNPTLPTAPPVNQGWSIKRVK